MNYLTRTVLLLRLNLHRSRIRRCRQQGRKLMHRSGELVSPELLTLNARIDHYGCAMRRLEESLRASRSHTAEPF